MKKLLSSTAAIILAVIMLVFPVTANAAVSGKWPVQPEFTIITTNFDSRRNVTDSGYHNGIDIQADGGSNIYAAHDGTVTFSGWMDAYGYTVILWHSDLGVYTFYAHCSALKCSAGASVSAGQVIGLVGMTGTATGNHLHFGICTNLQNGWPTVTYYDPLTYFAYENVNTPVPGASEVCSCTEEYAGVYTTKNVASYMNIRSSHDANSSAVGTIPAGATIVVTKGNGKWAHVDYEGVSGYCNMDYMQKVDDIQSGMSVISATYPEGELEKGKSFSLSGIIRSNAPVTKVWGGVYNAADESPTEQVTEITTNTSVYDLASYFDKQIAFGKLDDGAYTYLVMAEDSLGNQFEIIRSSFWIGQKPEETVPERKKGDLNLDSSVNISDAVLLQQFLINKADIPDEVRPLADINESGKVDVFDLIILEQQITGE